jgi:tetratricopeptide (TPR) repeat protein
MITVNNNIGYTYLQMGLYENAIKHCKISLTLNKEVGIPESEAQSWDNMGNAYFEMGNFNTAGKYMKKSLAIFTELGNKRGRAIAEGGLGEILIEENKLSDAVQLFTSALDVFNEINDQPKLARFYIKRAMARQKLNDYDLAADDLAKAGEVAAILNDKTYIFMTKLYSALNHIKKDVMTIHSSEKTLKNLDDPKLEQENKALLYFHLWQISGSKIYADKSLKLYQPLYQSKLSYSIKQKIDLLRS